MANVSPGGEQQHSPLPWFVGPYYKSDIHNGNGRVAETGLMRGDQGIVDAEFIVRACNSHADLLAALKAIRTYCSPHLECTNQCNGGDEGPCDCEGICPRDLVDAAIQKAEHR